MQSLGRRKKQNFQSAGPFPCSSNQLDGIALEVQFENKHPLYKVTRDSSKMSVCISDFPKVVYFRESDMDVAPEVNSPHNLCYTTILLGIPSEILGQT